MHGKVDVNSLLGDRVPRINWSNRTHGQAMYVNDSGHHRDQAVCPWASRPNTSKYTSISVNLRPVLYQVHLFCRTTRTRVLLDNRIRTIYYTTVVS